MLEVLAVGPDDWPTWRRLRRAALAEAPSAFGSTLGDWSGDGDTEARWRDRLTKVPLNLVLALDGLPVGMVSATAPGENGYVELISLWVHPDARRQGVGDEAVRRVIAWAASAFPGSRVQLSVKLDNRTARGLYERHGFQVVGPSPDDRTEQLMRR